MKDQPELLAELLEAQTSYGETFYVPVRARWNETWLDENGDTVPALKDLKHDIGAMLNKAIAALEDNNDSLAGVLKSNINFNEVKGKTWITRPGRRLQPASANHDDAHPLIRRHESHRYRFPLVRLQSHVHDLVLTAAFPHRESSPPILRHGRQ